MQKIDAEIEETKGKLAKSASEKHDEIIEAYKSLQNKREDALKKLQKAYRIKIEGDRVPELQDSFDKLQKKYRLSKGFIQKVKSQGYTRPTPVQMQALPILFDKRDAIILAETGSGKSLAFIAPLIHMNKKGDGLKAIIVVPTRELAIQLYKEFLVFSSADNFHPMPRVKFLRKALVPKTDDQFTQFCKNCEILISTPLKLAELTDAFTIENISHLVVDEADKMFEMGFLE